MGRRIGFTPEHKRSSFFDYPKLKLEKGEKARITIVDDAPWSEFVHNLGKIIVVDGEVQMESVPVGNDGKTRERPKTEFMGKYLCLGDPDTLDRDESDPKNCPICKAYTENSSAIGKPQRRIAFHVLKHSVKKGSFEIQKPFQTQVMAWEMPDTRFGTLVDIASEHGDLRKIDLCLGPCKMPQWQSFDIQPGRERVLDDDDNRQLALAVLKENMSEDLSPLLGRTISASEAQAKINEILDMWNRGFGQPQQVSGSSTKPESQDSGLDFSSLLGARKEAAETATEPTQGTPPWSNEEQTTPDAPNLTTLANDTPTEEKQVSKTDDIPDLDALLGGLR